MDWMGLTWQQSVSHDHKFGIYFDILKGFFISFSGLFGVMLCNACPPQWSQVSHLSFSCLIFSTHFVPVYEK